MTAIPALTQIISGDADDPSRDMSNWNAIRNVVNGGLDTTNLSATAGITAAQTVFGFYTAPTTWVPIFTASGGTPTTVTTTVARYSQIGKIVNLSLQATVTDKGSATGSLLFTLPVTAQSSFIMGGSGVETNTTGDMFSVTGNSATIAGAIFYNESTLWNNGYVIRLGLTYEAA